MQPHSLNIGEKPVSQQEYEKDSIVRALKGDPSFPPPFPKFGLVHESVRNSNVTQSVKTILDEKSQEVSGPKNTTKSTQVQRTNPPNASVTSTLPGGIKLVRYYDSTSSLTVDQQCGSVSYHTTLMNQIKSNVSYYDSPDGTNKFFKHVTIEVYSPNVTFPDPVNLALTYPTGTASNPGTSTIKIQKFPDDPSSTPVDYKYQGAISHEMGHAYHNWTRCFDSAQPYSSTFSSFFEKEVSSNGSTFSPTAYPWHNPPRADETKQEQFANAFRYFMGTNATKGKSGPPKDPVQPGFNDPASNPQWGVQLKLLPELTAYWDTYGLSSNSLSFLPTGTSGYYWQFVNGALDTVAQTDYNTWFIWNGSNWLNYYPSYNRF